jgi:glutathione S-transferase
MSSAQLTLISHPLCPFVQRAAIVLLEKGTPFQRLDVDLAARPEWFLALSPTGKVPLLRIVLGDGTEAVLFESVAICEYLNETQAGASLYSGDALARAQERAWVEFGTATLSDAWQFLNAKDHSTAEVKSAALRGKLQRLEQMLDQAPYFEGHDFSMVDVVFAPIFRYFDLLDPAASTPIFESLARVSAWRKALADRRSVMSAVSEDYPKYLREHLTKHGAVLSYSVL